METPPLHELNESLAPLLGIWRGSGSGTYPTVDAFAYNEELSFGHVGKPFLAMQQRTKHADTGLPLHAETGYLRPQPDGTVELVLSQPSGILEILTGEIDTTAGLTLDLASVAVHRSPSAKIVTQTRRRLVVDGDSLVIDMWMAAMGVSLTHHLTSSLERA